MTRGWHVLRSGPSQSVSGSGSRPLSNRLFPVDNVSAGSTDLPPNQAFVELFNMDNDLFQPYERLIEIQIAGRCHQVPASNLLLRCFQYLCMEDVSCGRFCWNQDCKTCAIAYELEPGQQRTGLSCQTVVIDGMKIVRITKELKWALRSILSGLGTECPPVSAESDSVSVNK
jgi:hypothetical protein